MPVGVHETGQHDPAGRVDDLGGTGVDAEPGAHGDDHPVLDEHVRSRQDAGLGSVSITVPLVMSMRTEVSLL